jgi:phosphoribosylaminoimidazole-succinocarboxamide synthase
MMTEKEINQYMAEQEEISKEIFKAKGARYIKSGKTKAVGIIDDKNQVVMRFLDSFTGTAGVKDGGGNEIAGHQDGLGYMNLAMTWKVFEMLSKDCGIPTQNIDVDFEKNVLTAKTLTLLGSGMKFKYLGSDTEFVKKGETYTSGGIEIIARNIAVGSVLTRFPYFQEGSDLRNCDGLPMIETSVKHDNANDPIFLWQYFVQQGVNACDLQKAMGMTAIGAKFLTEKFENQGLKFKDTKMEFGYTKDGNLVLGDEISTGTSRVFDAKGNQLTEKQIYEAVMSI